MVPTVVKKGVLTSRFELQTGSVKYPSNSLFWWFSSRFLQVLMDFEWISRFRKHKVKSARPMHNAQCRQNWNICDGKCATGIFKTFGGKFPTPLFQTEKVRNFFSLMWKKSDENLLIYEVWKMCDDYLLQCGRFVTKYFSMLENVRRLQSVSFCWKMSDSHK